MKFIINKTELTGNLAADVRNHESLHFITIATWNGKDKDGKNLPATFTDVALRNQKKEILEKLLKGQRVSITGKLTNYKNKDGHRMTGVFAYKIEIIEKDHDENEKVDETIFEDPKIQEDIAAPKKDWELDL